MESGNSVVTKDWHIQKAALQLECMLQQRYVPQSGAILTDLTTDPRDWAWQIHGSQTNTTPESTVTDDCH
jgi:hypothetical protein